MSKPQRQHRISEILEAHAVTSQGQLCELLEAAGITATQATVSRDLDELGAIKVRVPGGDTVYAIPEHPAERVTPLDNLRRVLTDWLVGVDHSGNIVVLRTPPGSAHVVASAIDRSSLSGILGSVAGDDTVMIIAAESTSGAALAAELRDMAALA